MKAIVGLGNPGPRYRGTRHNVGWQVIEELVRRWGGDKAVLARHAELVKATYEGQSVLLLKPQTFMNDSGKTVRALVEKDGLEPEDVLVIYDDLDLAVGRIRLRGTGSAGGHRGILSIQQQLAAVPRLKNRPLAGGVQEAAASHVPGGGVPERRVPERDGQPGAGSRKPEAPPFPRLKVGIGRPPSGVDPIDFVLAGFVPDEVPLIRQAIERAADATECWASSGTDVAANRFNGM
ncbi:MAG: aminoacyl-tRNA hydrolase [Chloroflexota bacterium]|nr:aminoacyl-tRNA hydrolase [Chloroflexota bacterium]